MKRENGQALAGVLIALAIGALLLAPFINYISTGIRSSSRFGGMMEKEYSAGAGVEDAMWRLTHDADFAASVDDAPVTYDITVNDLDVLVTVELATITDRLYVQSTVTETGVPGVFLFTINVTNIGTSTIFLTKIGDRLPKNFTYISGSCQDYEDNIAISQQGAILEPDENLQGNRWELVWHATAPYHFRDPVDSGETRTQRFRGYTTGTARYNEAWIDPQPSSQDISSSVHRYYIKAEAGGRTTAATISAEAEPKVLSWQLGLQ